MDRERLALEGSTRLSQPVDKGGGGGGGRCGQSRKANTPGAAGRKLLKGDKPTQQPHEAMTGNKASGSARTGGVVVPGQRQVCWLPSTAASVGGLPLFPQNCH